jgi:electron transport complex protein RnfG
MAKLESTLTNMLMSLGGIALVASALLGFAYQATKGPIAAANKKILENAIKVVSPADLKDSKLGEMYKLPVEGGDSLACYPVMDTNGKLVVTAISTYTNKGFSGHFSIMVGFTPDGTIVNTAVLAHSETPGLGDKMSKSKSEWSTQFNGKNPETYKLKVTKDGGDVDAITAATISSRAFCDATDRAYTTYMKLGKHE